MIFTDLRHLRILLSKGRRWMITLGMDPHPGSHTRAALDSNGSLLGSIKVLNTSAGLEQLHQFAAAFVSRRWAITYKCLARCGLADVYSCWHKLLPQTRIEVMNRKTIRRIRRGPVC